MPDALERVDVETALRRIETVLAGLEERVRVLEGRATAGAAAADAVPAPANVVSLEIGPAAPAAERLDVAAVLSLVGRTFVVFGGAYLLRALTDSGRLPPGAGVALGVAYAVAWLVAADRAAFRARPASAVFHGMTAVLIALPLLWEASTRFGLLAPQPAAGALGAFTGLALAIAWRRGLQALAGAATLGALALALGLTGFTAQVAPFAVFLILLGVATLWLAYDRDWFWLRWPAALVADIVVLGVVSRAVGADHAESWHVGVGIPLLLLFAYLASFAARTLVRGRAVIPFEVAQTVAGLGIGLGGAIAVAHAQGGGESALGAAAAALGAGCYAVAFAFVERRQGLGVNFVFYSTLALVLTLAGAGILLPPTTWSVVTCLLAVTTTWLAWHRSRVALAAHGAVYICVAAAGSGLITWAVAVFVGAGGAAPPTAAAWIAMAASLVCLGLPRPSQQGLHDGFASAPRLVNGVVLVFGVGAVLVSGLVRLTAGSPADPGIVATDRTAVLALAALALALAGTYRQVKEFGWLLYPVLFAGALKLLLEDFPRSRPSTLFLALALYGVALIAAPRLARRAPSPSA